MRTAFINTLEELAIQDERIVLLTADLGFMVVDQFRERFPNRFINVGVAEQNLIGVAAGMAKFGGYIPFVYSMVPFSTMRPYEFIRNCVIAHNLQVRIIGVGGGFEYGSAGFTHYGLEDVAIMRVQPDISVIAPSDHAQARTALLATWDMPGPVYYRIGKDDKTLIPGLSGQFDFGKIRFVREGSDGLILTMGSMTAECMKAAKMLSEKGVEYAVVIVPTLNPAPAKELSRVLEHYKSIVTVENHYLTGGLGSMVAEVVADRGLCKRVVRIGIKNLPNGITGREDFMHGLHGLSAESITNKILGLKAK